MRAGTILAWTVGVVVVALGLWAIVWGSVQWHHGIYAGFHYDGAKKYVSEVMAENEGLAFSKQMRLGEPDVLNTHTRGGLFDSGQQVREFHLVGPNGVKWCVTVWDGGRHWNRDYQIKKGCEWK